MNAIKCLYTSSRRYAMLVAESLDGDTFERSIMPVYYTSEGEAGAWTHAGFFNNTLNSFMNHAADGFYQAQLRMSRFPGILQLGRSYNVTYTGTIPGSMRYQLQGTEEDTDSIVVTIPYVRPETVRVSVGPTKEEAVEVEATTGNPDNDINTVVNLFSEHGKNQWFFTTNKIKFAMRGSDFVYLDIIDAIQLTMRLDVTSEEFWASSGPTDFIDRMAAALNIPSYRVRVVDTYRGSTVVVSRILADDSLSTSSSGSTSESASVAELNTIQALLVEKAQSNELGMAYPVMELTAKVVSADPTTDTTVDDDSSEDSGTIIAYDDPNADSVDEDGNPVEGGSLADALSGDSDDDDEWYYPLSFNQMVAIAIGGGVLVIGGVLASVIFCNKKPKIPRMQVIPAKDKMMEGHLSEDPIIEPEFFSATHLAPIPYSEIVPYSPEASSKDSGLKRPTDATVSVDRSLMDKPVKPRMPGKVGEVTLLAPDESDVFDTARSPWEDSKGHYVGNTTKDSPKEPKKPSIMQRLSAKKNTQPKKKALTKKYDL